MAHPYWPLFDLVVRTPRLELRPPDDAACTELTGIAGPEMFRGGDVYFKLDWVRLPSPRRERESLQFWWGNRGSFSAKDWHLDMAVFVDGRPVGVQGVRAKAFPTARTVTTGSWLTAAAQGHGYGKEMRRAVLHFAFLGLGAEEARSGAFLGNERSIAVSRSVGYEDNGYERAVRAGERGDLHQNFRMTRERFDAVCRRDDIVVENLAPCLEMFGLGEDLAPLA